MTYIPTVTDLSDIRARAALGIGHLSVTDVVVLCAEVERLRSELERAELRAECAENDLGGERAAQYYAVTEKENASLRAELKAMQQFHGVKS